MDNQLALKARIAQLKAGKIAPPHTWITSYNVNKNGKKYTYYRLMKADPTRSLGGKMRGKMVKYLGSSDSCEYKKMKQAITRRNQLQALLRQLHSLEKAVSGGKTLKKQNKQPPLTLVLGDLMTQIKNLQTEFNSLKQEFKNLSSTLAL